MADAKSDYLERELLDHALGTASMTSPTDVYMSLHTESPDDDASGSEVSGGSYAREIITFNAAATLAGVTTADNDADVEFTDLPTAVVTHFGIWDALTTGNLLYHGPLTNSKSLTAGDSLTFAAGAVVIEEQ